ANASAIARSHKQMLNVTTNHLESSRSYGFAVTGGRPLNGTIRISGSKISSITMLCSALISPGPVVLERVPNLADLEVLCRCLTRLGAEVDRRDGQVKIQWVPTRLDTVLPSEWISSVHGTLYLLPALLVRNGFVDLSRPTGGCEIGVRPIA